MTNTAAPGRLLTRDDLPPKPAIVADWERNQARQMRDLELGLRSGTLARVVLDGGFADVITHFEGLLVTPPAEVVAADREWVAAYNRVVEALNRQRQARVNAREIAQVRAAACPRCFATHAGEC